MPIKKIDEITDKQIKDNGVQALADRPNLPNQYGASGLSASQLKAWFDKLATFLAHRINEITNALSSEDAASYIRVQLDEYDVDNLGDLITAFSNGEFASKILKVYPYAGATATIPLQSLLSTIAQTLREQSSKINSIETNVGEKLKSIVDLSSEQTIDGVKYFTGYNSLGRGLDLEENASIVGSDILIRTDDKLSWYRGDYIMFYSAGLTTWTRYDNGAISHCYLPPEGGLPITIDLAIPKGESYNRTIATREWVEEQGFADSDALGGKLDKITTPGNSRIYKVNSDGTQGVTTLNDSPFENAQWRVPMYFPQDYMEAQSASYVDKIPGGGTLYVINPKYRGQVANKAYVDEAVANVKLYRHTITLSKYSDDRGVGVLNCSFEVISSRSTAFSTLSELASIFSANNITVSANYYYADGIGIVRLNILASQNTYQLWIDGVILNSDNVPIAKSIHTNDTLYILNVSIHDTVTAL